MTKITIDIPDNLTNKVLNIFADKFPSPDLTSEQILKRKIREYIKQIVYEEDLEVAKQNAIDSVRPLDFN